MIDLPRPALRIGFALTQHCNLRCAHCIRDDVTSFAELDAGLVLRIIREAREHCGALEVAFTGGEPLLHRQWHVLLDGLRDLHTPYSFVSNGWHMPRFMPQLLRYPPTHVRLSLSGADAHVHDAERGRDSFRRVLHATLLLSAHCVPVSYSLIVDRRTRHQLVAALQLATSMRCAAIRYILPQPVPASAQRDTDLPPQEWWQVRRDIEAIARRTSRATRVFLEYGAPFDGSPAECDTMKLQRFYVDVHGRLSTCCQLSEYGANESDVVADLNRQSFAAAYGDYGQRIAQLRQISAPADNDDMLRSFPCLRCARATGKLDWLRNFPDSPWAPARAATTEPYAPLVPLTYLREAV